MTLREFAQHQRLRARRDEDGSLIVPGRDGHLYEHGDGRLAVMLLSPGPLTAGSRQRWAYRRRACLAAGMELWQHGDDEGTCLFDPADPSQAMTAIKVAGVKRRRRLSAEQREKLVQAGTRHRFRPATGLEGRVTAQEARSRPGPYQASS